MSDAKPEKYTQNPITGIGVFLTTISAVSFLVFVMAGLFGYHTNPYLGIFFFLILPAFFVLGLLLIPVGIARERSRRFRGLPPSQWKWPKIDLNSPLHRRTIALVAGLTVANVLLFGLATERALHYMDSVEFCGAVCHTVMQPEYVAYQDGPHSRVKCVECHIGPGAPWLVKSKIDGVRQVWAVATDTYSRPIPTPVHDLRPARDTCENCHWPEKFTGDVVRTFPAYESDEANTDSSTTMQLHVGGGGWRYGGPHGIHWHTSPGNKVEYIPADEERQTIPWVRLTDANGKVTEFVVKDTDMTALRQREVRTMDCVDCHNRPSHRFEETPEEAVDSGLLSGLLPRNLPFVRRESVSLLKAKYPSHAAAEQAIKGRLENFYGTQYPDLVKAGDGRIPQAIAGAQRLYTHNVFPAMDVTWGTHPNNLGHTDSPGCFRCHDDSHESKDGRTISQDCETCHKIVE